MATAEFTFMMDDKTDLRGGPGAKKSLTDDK